MGLAGIYSDPIPEDVGVSIITHAFGRGITFFDTSDIYGPKTNEILVGKVLSHSLMEYILRILSQSIVNRVLGDSVFFRH